MPRLARFDLRAFLRVLARSEVVVACLVVSVAAAAPAHAQDPTGDPPAHISIVDGAAVLERDGRTETAPSSMPLLAGDRLRTQGGRVEVLFADGSTLHLDANTTVDFQSDEVVRLLTGRVRLNIAGTRRGVAYRVDAPSAWVQIDTPGEYRIAVTTGSEIELAVVRGSAELVNEDGRTGLGAGERAFARLGASPSSPYVFNSAAWDAFDTWSEMRRSDRLGAAAEYLPDTVQPYASTFATYGTWQNEPTYGYVWYPRVRSGWRPYYHGRWTTLRPWGWTWIGADPWAWPTHHYGRWGYSTGGWFWIPGRTWGAAWVSWAYAPGYVSWCPLGWNNRPVFSFVNVNIYGGRRYDPWHAWTVVPHRGFGRGAVNINVVNVSRIDLRTRNTFVVRDSAPDYRGYAVPRSAAPIRTAVSRDGVFGGNGANGAYGGSRVAPSATRDRDAGASFRSRGGTAGSLSGPGYPPAARTPSRSAPTIDRVSPDSVTPPRQNGIRTRDSSAPSGDPGPLERRAVPRSAPRNEVSTSPSIAPSQPSRRAAPDYRAAPAPPQTDPRYRSVPDGSNRAVPRGERRGGDLYEPSRTYGVQPDRSPYRAAEPSRAPDAAVPRAVPRSEPQVVPNRGIERSAPPVERSRPSGVDRPSYSPPPPPPSRAPESRAPERAAPSRGQERAPDNGGSRSRGGGESSGRAVSRSRGGR
jgi:hypothetical protein